MASSHNERRVGTNRTNENDLATHSERARKLARTASRTLLATAVVGVGGFLITSGASKEDILPVSATQGLEVEAKMDKMIASELQKGPQGGDIILNDGRSFTIGPSASVGDAMIRVDARAQIGANPAEIIHTKATTASAENFEHENGGVFSESEAVMWADDELGKTFGRTVLLAIPADRPEL